MSAWGTSVRARFSRLVVAATCAAVAVALTPAVAFGAPGATFLSEYLKGTLHGQRFAVGVLAYSSQAMVPSSASIKIDGVAVKTTVSTTSFGHWQYSETGPDANGAYKVTSTWVADSSRKNQVALSASPPSAALVNGTHTVVASVKDAKGNTFTDTWTYTLAAPAATIFGTPSPLVVGSGTSLFNVNLSVSATDPVGIKGATMLVDGVAKTPSVAYAGYWETDGWTDWFVPDYTQATIGFRMPSLTVGSHAVTITVTNNSNQAVSKAWTVDVQPAQATFSLMSPAPGATVAVWDQPVCVVLGDPAGINDGPTLTIDGVPHTLTLQYGYGSGWLTLDEWTEWSYNDYPGPGPLDMTRALATFSPGMLTDGDHAVSIAFTDATGRSASTSWTFTVAAPPKLSGFSPADKGSVSSRTPVIAAKVVDNGTISSTAMSVDGVTVPATYDASSGTLSYTPAVPLANDAVHSVSVSATDAGGRSATAGWSFTVQVYPGMPEAGTCTDCHDATQHPMSNCNACHGVVYIGHGLGGPVQTCTQCHGSGGHGPEKIIPGVTWGGGDDPQPGYTGYWGNYCDYCHSPKYPSIPQHAADNAVLHLTTTDLTSCNECHVRELTREHFRYKNTAGAQLDCWTCHGANASAQVKAAIASGSTACDACHTGAQHESLHNVAPRLDDCARCHAGDSLTVVHANVGCAVCHDTTDEVVIAAVAGGEKDCATCHAGADHATLHAIEPLPRTDSCVSCHAGDNLVAIHATCEGCHDSTNPAVVAAILGGIKACSACHVTAGVDYHLNMSVHITPGEYYDSCGHCHHGWGSYPGRGPDVTKHAGGCATCHNATTDLTGLTTGCDSCHKAEGVGFHPKETVYHSAQDPTSLACATCHKTTDVRVLHTSIGCQTCHITYSCTECHKVHNAAPGTVLGQGTSCGRCHNTVGVNYHKDFTAKHTFSAMSASCQVSGCHSNQLVAAHEPYVGTGKRYPQYADTCTLCHLNADASRIPAGATADCSSCHNSADHVAIHDSTVTDAEISISGVSYGTRACSECHSSTNLVSAHNGACASCHPDPVGVFGLAGGWNKTCVQGGCHADPASASQPMHGGIDTAHAYPSDRSDCIASGCHDAGAAVPFDGRNVAAIHANVTTTTPAGQTYSSCGICHSRAFSATLTTECLACHADRAQPHGYDAAMHTANSTCVGSCHAQAAGMTELKPLHDAALGAPMACGACHPAKADEVSPWDKTCTACHPIADLHAAAASLHVGTDVAYREASLLGNGCTAEAGHTDMLACHTIGNVALVHAGMASNGCPVCHGAGKTPSQECLDCHQPGESTEYVKPGSLASANATFYPSSDNFITPGWTYTTTPAGQARYAVVNAPYPPADTSRYVTVTTSTAGGMLFGYNPASSPIPANATIVQVQVFAKAKAANVTYPRKMQGLWKVGGTTYQTGNQSGVLPNTGWLGGTGAGQGLASSPIQGYDYTFDMYGMAIYGNPKTGQRWTPAQLMGTDSNGNNLEAFGVALTASTAANNVSLSQVYLKVLYYVRDPAITYPTVGTHTYHQDNVKYLHDPADAGGRSWAVNPAHGWYDALFYQDCYDFCHRGNAQQPAFAAEQGTWMWYSIAGDPSDPLTQARYLTLKPITVPSGSPTLSFKTRYGFGGSDTGQVEVSTDGGISWTALAGTVGGMEVSTLTGASGAWVPASYDLSAYAGRSVKLRFSAGGASSATLGWGVDEISISGDGATVFSDDAETLKPDWTNTWWTRSMGAFPYL